MRLPGVEDMAGRLVGRDAELEALRSFLEDASGGPSALSIEGEPGIGKSALWLAAAEEAKARGLRALIARPAEAEGRVSYSALGDLLAEVFDEARSELQTPQARALGVALLVEDPGPSPPDRRAIALGLRGVVQTLARSGPVVVAIDDLQWLDAPSAAALGYALKRLGEEPVRVVVTVREEGHRPDRLSLERTLPQGRVRRLNLGPLSLGALHRILVDRLGTPVPRSTLLRINEACAGNPFYALELARELLQRGRPPSPGEPLPIPGDLDSLLRARVLRLRPGSRRALALAAALSDPRIPSLEATSDRPTRLLADLEEAVAAGVVEIDGERIRFTHPLLRSAITSWLLPARRREIHRRLAGVVADPEERARHLALAAQGPDHEVAAALDRGAGHAAARGAPEAAAELMELAVRLTPGERGEDLLRRWLEAADHHLAVGDFDRVRAICEGLLPQLPPGGARGEVLLRLGALPDDLGRSIVILERAVRECGDDGDRGLRATLLLGAVRSVVGSVPEALAEGERALAMAERTGDPALLAPVLAEVALLRVWAGDPDPDLIRRARELRASSTGQVERFDPPYDDPDVASGLFAMYRDRPGEARVFLEGALARATDAGNEADRFSLLLHLTELECRAGDLIRADQHAAELMALSEQIGLEYQGGASLYPKAMVDAYLGRVEEARAAAERGAKLSEAIGDEIFRIQNEFVQGFLDLSLGDLAGADRHLRPLPERLAELGWGEPSVSPVLPNAAEVAIGLGELDRADRLTRQLEERGRALDSGWARATGARCRGLLLAARGDLAGALEVLEGALAEHGGMPVPLELGRTLLAKGRVERRAKRWRAARGSLGRAAEVFEGMGARLWTEQARQELGRVGGRPLAPLELTETERRVAELIAGGLTTGEAAERLFLTPKAVEANLTKVYRKLGVGSRAELGARMASERPAAR
ncbi:MAG TPA: AAA family ATPase [Actinomycetota bacterium]|jgi:DNA-binding CsgD family transcriptional regulator